MQFVHEATLFRGTWALIQLTACVCYVCLKQQTDYKHHSHNLPVVVGIVDEFTIALNTVVFVKMQVLRAARQALTVVVKPLILSKVYFVCLGLRSVTTLIYNNCRDKIVNF